MADATADSNGAEGNAEGQEPSKPLPSRWTLQDLRSQEIKLYGGVPISPPCSKMRVLFEFYEVPFEEIRGARPTGNYSKIPALDVGEYILNDSYIMVKSLAPILQGRALYEKELELEKEMTFGLMVAMERAAASTPSDIRSCSHQMGGFHGIAMYSMSCCLARVGASRIGSDAPEFLGKEVGQISDYGDMLRAYLNGREYLGVQNFLGAAEPKVIDVTLFGMLLPFEKAQCACLAALLGNREDPLFKWFERMHGRYISTTGDRTLPAPLAEDPADAPSKTEEEPETDKAG